MNIPRLIGGVAILDADYVLTKYKYTNGKKKRVWVCPYYDRWLNMIDRCYLKGKEKPTYEECFVCDEWLTFSNFKRWMETKNWEGMDLDKDFIFKGNKIYSPETCFFITRITNNFMLDNASRRKPGNLTGSYYNKERSLYEARCRNPFTKKKEYLGRFVKEIDAHKAWKRRKNELAIELSKDQEFEQVKTRLLTEYK